MKQEKKLAVMGIVLAGCMAMASLTYAEDKATLVIDKAVNGEGNPADITGYTNVENSFDARDERIDYHFTAPVSGEYIFTVTDYEDPFQYAMFEVENTDVLFSYGIMDFAKDDQKVFLLEGKTYDLVLKQASLFKTGTINLTITYPDGNDADESIQQATSGNVEEGTTLVIDKAVNGEGNPADITDYTKVMNYFYKHDERIDYLFTAPVSGEYVFTVTDYDEPYKYGMYDVETEETLFSYGIMDFARDDQKVYLQEGRTYDISLHHVSISNTGTINLEITYPEGYGVNDTVLSQADKETDNTMELNWELDYRARK